MNFRRASIAVFLAISAVAIVAAIAEATKIYSAHKHETYMRNLETEVVRITLAGHPFDIPMRYLYGQAIEKYHQWPKAKKERVNVDALTLSVLLPELRPYYLTDDALWKVKGHGSRVEVSIMKPVGGADWYVSMRNRYLSGTAPGNITKKTQGYGLIQFSGARDRYFPSDQSAELTIACDRPDSAKWPSCMTKSNYQPGIVLEYYYALEYLPRWREIDEILKGMFNSFAQTAELHISAKKE